MRIMTLKKWGHAFYASPLSLMLGDSSFVGGSASAIIHAFGNSDDSICPYDKAEGVLFVGASHLPIGSREGSYKDRSLATLEKRCARSVRQIYLGHGRTRTERCNESFASHNNSPP